MMSLAQLHMFGRKTQHALVRRHSTQLAALQLFTSVLDVTLAPQPGQVTTSGRAVHTLGNGRAGEAVAGYAGGGGKSPAMGAGRANKKNKGGVARRRLYGGGMRGKGRQGWGGSNAAGAGRRESTRGKTQWGGYQEGEANRGGRGATGGGSQQSSEKRWAETLKAEGDAVLAGRGCEAWFLLFSVRARERSRARMRWQ